MGFRQQGTKLVPVKCIVIVPEQKKVETDRRGPPSSRVYFVAANPGRASSRVHSPRSEPFSRYLAQIEGSCLCTKRVAFGSEIRRTAMFIMLIVPHPNLASRFHRHTESHPVDPVRNRTQTSSPRMRRMHRGPSSLSKFRYAPLFFAEPWPRFLASFASGNLQPAMICNRPA